MDTFFEPMDPNLRLYWYIAIGASIIFVIQTILTLLGSDSDSIDANFDGDLDTAEHPFQLFSFRNLINLLLGFGWGGVFLFESIPNQFVLGTVSFLIGLSFVGIFFLVIRSLWKLEEDNTFRIEESVKKTAEVYLPIPANKEGKGKVLVSVRGSIRELDAITYGSERIETGRIVTIVGVENTILIVNPL